MLNTEQKTENKTKGRITNSEISNLWNNSCVGRAPCPQAAAASAPGSTSDCHWEKPEATTSPPAWWTSLHKRGHLWAQTALQQRQKVMTCRCC